MTSVPAAGVVRVPALERRLLLPVIGRTVALRNLQLAVSHARADTATVHVVQLITLSRRVPLEGSHGDPLDPAPALRQQLVRFGVRAELSISRGRTNRHALARALADGYDCIVVGTRATGCNGFSAADIAWLAARARGEIVVLSASPGEPRLSLA